MLIAHNSSGIKTFEQLRSALKTRSVAVGVNGADVKSAVEEVFYENQNLLTVFYASDAQIMQNILNKSIEIGTVTWAQESRVATGEFVALAVFTPRGRNGVKSLTELGFPVSAEGWNGFWLPPETPVHIRDSMYKILERARADKELQTQLTNVLNGGVPPKQSPEQFADFIDREFAKALARKAREKTN
jgi:tripartite-type tricarboxylate transporter receptor subunit TctC